MRPGNRLIIFLLIFFSLAPLKTEEKITTSPLINLKDIKPSFDDLNEKKENQTLKKNLKVKKKIENLNETSHAILIGLDKITAKSSHIKVNIDEIKNFGPLEIKILKCAKIKVNNGFDDVAYMQVKDVSKNENEKVFIFNGWTFSSDPNLTPFDHAIYDLQLLNCFNI